MRLALASLVLCLSAGTAHAADRGERAQAIFDQSCSLCHVLGKSPGDDPREKTVLDPTQAKWTEAWVRRWLDAPEKVNPATMCLGNRIDPVAKDILVSFLRVKHTAAARLDVQRRGGGPSKLRRTVAKPGRGGQ